MGGCGGDHIFGFFAAPASSLGYRPLISGYTIILYILVLYVALSSAIPIFFNNMRFIYVTGHSSPGELIGTLAVHWLGIVLFVLFYHLFSFNRPAHPPAQPLWRPAKVKFLPLAYALVVVGVLLKIAFIQRSGGLAFVLVSRSAGLSQGLGLNTATDHLTGYLIELSYVGDAAACWLFLNALRFRKAQLIHTGILLLVLGVTFLSTPKRENLLPSLLSIIVGLSIYKFRLRLTQAPLFLVGALSFTVVTLAGRIFLPAYIAGINVLNFARGDLVKKFALQLFSADLGFFDDTALAVYAPNEILGKFNNWWDAFYRPNLEPFLYIIPRSLWPSKPDQFVDISTALRAAMWGGLLKNTVVGMGLGAIGTSWVYGGVVGLFIGMAILGGAASYVDRFLPKMHYASPGRILAFAASLTILFHLYRQATLGWLFMIFIQMLVIFWIAAMALTYSDTASIEDGSSENTNV